MKKLIVLALCLMVVGFLTVNGTLAFPDINEVFADLEGVIQGIVSRFNPKPEQDEAQFEVRLVSQIRGERGLVETNELPTLIPGYTPGQQVLVEYDEGGYPYQLWDTAGVVDRFTSVRNISQIAENNPNDAYFRIAIALQEEAADLIHLHFNENKQDYEWSEWNKIKIGGRAYRMKVGTYLHALPVGVVSPAALLQAALDKQTTSEQIAALRSDFLQIQVVAIDADDFVTEKDGVVTRLSAREALGYAVPLTSTFNPFE